MCDEKRKTKLRSVYEEMEALTEALKNLTNKEGITKEVKLRLDSIIEFENAYLIAAINRVAHKQNCSISKIRKMLNNKSITDFKFYKQPNGFDLKKI